MAKKFQYGIPIAGFCLALAAGQMASPGLAAAAPAHRGAVIRAYGGATTLAHGGATTRAHGGAAARAHVVAVAVTRAHPAAWTVRDATMGHAATRGTAPRHRTPTAAAPGLTICSFDGTRSRAPFATATGSLGYDQMRGDLVNPAEFGPNGTVHRTIIIATGVPAITSANLAGCNVFFTSVFSPGLSSDEAAALKIAYGKGLRVITDADSDTDEMNSANSVMTAVGLPAGFGGATACPNDANGGVVRLAGAGDAALVGPFGDLRGNTWGTSVGAAIGGNFTAAVKCGRSTVRNVTAAKLFVGGDPSGFNLFTSSGESLFNPTNEAAYLNFIGAAN